VFLDSLGVFFEILGAQALTMRQSFVAPSYHRIVLGLSMLVVVFVHVFLDRITRIYFHS